MWEVSKVFMQTILPEIDWVGCVFAARSSPAQDEEPTGLFFACGIYGKHAPDPAPRLDGRAFRTRFRLKVARKRKLNVAQREHIRFDVDSARAEGACGASSRAGLDRAPNLICFRWASVYSCPASASICLAWARDSSVASPERRRATSAIRSGPSTRSRRVSGTSSESSRRTT